MKSLKQKLLLSFLLIILFTLVIGGFNFYSTMEANKSTEEIVDHELPLLIYNEKLSFNIAQRIALSRGYVLFGDSSYRDLFDQYTKDSKEIQDELLKLSNSEMAKALIDKSVTWRKIITDEVFMIYDKGNNEEAKRILLEKAQPLAREIMDGFAEMTRQRETNITEHGNKLVKDGNITNMVGLTITAIVLLVGITLALFLANNITKPIKLVVNRMKLISNGDLSNEDIHINSKDEIGLLAQSINEMQHDLKDVIQFIAKASERVTSQSEELTQSSNEVQEGSEQIASTMEELSAGAESQANSATNISEVMKEFVRKIQEAERIGVHVSESSSEVLALTGEGRQLMEKSVNQMMVIDQIVKDSVSKVKGLDDQSKEISKLVQVIQDIADQTNLLSLNAAIEAARAGEHGRGFAVVADEVRKLAEQVSLSVEDITGIVSNIQMESSNVANSLEAGYHEVNEGSKQIELTGQTFGTINVSISNMAENISSISDYLKEIVGDSNQMNNSIDEIASVSEESAAGIQQVAASSEQTSSSMEEVARSANDLEQLAEQLSEQVRHFQLT